MKIVYGLACLLACQAAVLRSDQFGQGADRAGKPAHPCGGVTSMFGHDFAEAVFKLEPGVWSGPVKSGLGLHLVAVSKIDQAEQRPFENVRTEVKDEWLRERQEIASREYLARLREKYGVVIDDDVQALLSPGADAAMASSGEGAVQ
jgi:hypothetical protein